MKHPLTLAERVKANPFDTNKPMFRLGDHFGIESEERIFKVMEECYAVQGRRPALIRVQTTPDKHPNPLVYMLRNLEKFALPIEVRDEFYRINYTRDMNDPKQRQEYEISKKAEKCYEKLFLTIWAEGLAEKWKPSEPASLVIEFEKSNKDYDQLLNKNLVNKGKKGFFDILDETRKSYFGSLDKYKEFKINFYDKKVNEFNS